MLSMQPQTKRKRTQGILLLVIGLILIGYTWATWRFFTEPIPGGNDFLTHYGAWEAFLRHGMNPYSDEAALHTQTAIYGRPAQPGEDENRLVYPFYSVLVHGPFVYMEYAVARAIYMTLLQVVIAVGIILTLRLVRWEPPVWMLAVIVTWSLLHYPEARAVIIGQFAPFAFLSLVGCLYLYRKGYDVWAGAVLIVSTMKPTLVFLVVPFLLLYFGGRRRWGAVGGFLGTFALFSLGGFLVLPTWVADYFVRLQTYSAYTVGQSPVWLLSHQYLPFLGRAGEIVLSVLLLLVLWIDWWKTIRLGGGNRFYWTLSLTLVISNLIVPRSATTNYVLLLLPTIWIFAALDRGWRGGRFVVLISMFALLVGHWWLHVATVVGNQEHAVMFLPWPILLGAVLWLGRSWLGTDAQMHALSA